MITIKYKGKIVDLKDIEDYAQSRYSEGYNVAANQ